MPTKRTPPRPAPPNGRSRELQRKLERLENKFEQLQQQYAQLQAKCQQQQTRIEELESMLAKAKKTSRNSSKPPSSDIAKPRAATPANNAGGKRKPGGQPGHKQHTRARFTPDQIDQIQRIPLGGCPCCGNNLAELETPAETFQQVEIEAKPVVVTEYQRGCGWCEHCQTSVKPDWPPGVVEAGLTGPRLMAMIGFLKGSCSMSIGMIQRYLRDCLQLHLSRGYIAKLLNRISGCLEEPYSELERMLPDEPLVNVDETGHKDNGKRFWTWVFRAEMFSFFRVSPSRSSQVLLDVLGKEFDGLLGCDYFSAYRRYMGLNENVRLQFCLAHLIRDVKFLVSHPAKSNRDHGEQLLALLRRMFSIIHRRDEYATEVGYRIALSRVRNEIVYKAAMEAPETREALNLSQRFLQHTESYFQFITEPTIDPTNNVAERAFRFVAIQRRITQGTRGRTGQLWSERIWTVMATCGQQGRSAYDYLVSAITAHCRHQPIPSLVAPNSSKADHCFGNSAATDG